MPRKKGTKQNASGETGMRSFTARRTPASMVVLTALAAAAACATTTATPGASSEPAAVPAPAPPPEATGPTWQPLFDGSTSKGWRAFKGTAFPETGWSIADGTLRSDKGAQVDIVTEQQYADFEFVLEFKLGEGGNSGIKYLVDESLVQRGTHGLGFEYQIIDDERHPDARQGKPGTRVCGALYDLIAPTTERKVNPPGQWNEVRLVVDGARIEHWLNGVKLLTFQRGSDETRALIADSKYKNLAGFGQPARGHILIQAHGDEVAFKNIRVRELRPGVALGR
jgi:hypothetical protein